MFSKVNQIQYQNLQLKVVECQSFPHFCLKWSALLRNLFAGRMLVGKAILLNILSVAHFLKTNLFHCSKVSLMWC